MNPSLELTPFLARFGDRGMIIGGVAAC